MYYYTVYKTTNLINNKVYIGCHKTKNPHDEYKGSSSNLSKAIKKYGKENFKKEILFSFDNESDMFEKEAELVTEEFVKSRNTYNAKVGGYGGWDHINDGSEKHRERCKRGAEKSNGLKTYNEECNSGIKQRKNLFTTESSLKANAYRIKNGLTEEHKKKNKNCCFKKRSS